MKKRTRLKDIAEALNMSITTVSRALNNKEDISPKTKQAVLEVAQLLNYSPNYFAKYLNENRNNLIGVIVPRIDHTFYATMIDGILKKAQELGYFILLGESLDHPINEQTLLTQYINLGAEGFIVAPAYLSTLLSRDLNAQLKKENIVLIDRSNDQRTFDQVTNNHLHGAYEAVNHLFDQGFKKVAHIKGLKEDSIAENIYQGYLKSISEHGQNPIIYQCDNVSPLEAQKATEILMTTHQPDAIFSISDEAALGIYRYCFEHSINIPQDLGVVGYSNASFSQYLTPSLTTVDQLSFDMGAHAVIILDQHHKDIPHHVNQNIFNSKLIIRESSQKLKI
jgi:LacI family transcriptional regulator